MNLFKFWIFANSRKTKKVYQLRIWIDLTKIIEELQDQILRRKKQFYIWKSEPKCVQIGLSVMIHFCKSLLMILNRACKPIIITVHLFDLVFHMFLLGKVQKSNELMSFFFWLATAHLNETKSGTADDWNIRT